MRIVPSTKRNLNVSIQMSRDSNREWNLRIEDEASSLLILEIKMDHEEFSDLLSTVNTTGKAKYYANTDIGKELSVKNVTIDLEDISEE